MLSQTVLMLSQLAFVALTVLAAWVLLVLIGLPFTLACLPRTRIWLTLPLAAVVAVSLITSIHEHLFFSLLQPYRPVVVYTAAIALSCAFLGIALLLRRESLATLAHEFIRGLARSWPFLVVPFVSAIAFGCLFAVNGLEMLSAGQDELGYVETTRHIANHMFTRDLSDLPWGRHQGCSTLLTL